MHQPKHTDWAGEKYACMHFRLPQSLNLIPPKFYVITLYC